MTVTPNGLGQLLTSHAAAEVCGGGRMDGVRASLDDGKQRRAIEGAIFPPLLPTAHSGYLLVICDHWTRAGTHLATSDVTQVKIVHRTIIYLPL